MAIKSNTTNKEGHELTASYTKIDEFKMINSEKLVFTTKTYKSKEERDANKNANLNSFNKDFIIDKKIDGNEIDEKGRKIKIINPDWDSIVNPILTLLYNDLMSKEEFIKPTIV